MLCSLPRSITVRIMRRFVMCIFLPLLSLISYWMEIDYNFNDNRLLLSTIVAILLSVALFFYVPIARKIERGSIAWGVIIVFAIMLACFAGIGIIGNHQWGFPLFFLACFAPAYHQLCRVDFNKDKFSFFKATMKSQSD